MLNDILFPKYSASEPSCLIPRLVYKYRRWQEISDFHVSWFMFHVSWLMAILGSWQFGVHGSRLMIHGKGFETPNWHFNIKTISDGR